MQEFLHTEHLAIWLNNLLKSGYLKMLRSSLTLLLNILLVAIIIIARQLNLTQINSMTNPLRREFLSAVYENSFLIILFASISQVFIGALGSYLVSPRTERAKLRLSILGAMRDDLFGGEKQLLRATIFKDCGYWKSFQCYWRLFFRAMKMKLAGKEAELPKLGNSYIMVWNRIGTEYPNSKTFLMVSKDTREKCDGIAARIRQSTETIIVHSLPDIQNFDLSDINHGNIPDNVKEYVQKTYTSLDTLRRLNRRALHYYGEIIYDQKINKGKPIGVLIVDSWQKENPFTEELKPKVQRYLQILGQLM